MADHDGNHRCLVEKNVPIALILLSRWHDGTESLREIFVVCLASMIHFQYYLLFGFFDMANPIYQHSSRVGLAGPTKWSQLRTSLYKSRQILSSEFGSC